jgi:hypothetical protein
MIGNFTHHRGFRPHTCSVSLSLVSIMMSVALELPSHILGATSSITSTQHTWNEQPYSVLPSNNTT